LLRLEEESILFLQNLIATDNLYVVGLVMPILKNGYSEEDRHPAENDLCGFSDGGLVPELACRSMGIRGADVLAKTNNKHLLDSAAEFAEEIRVWLDPIDNDNRIGLERGSAEDYGIAVAKGTDLVDVHAGFKGNAS
jgi:hypothetical protein